MKCLICAYEGNDKSAVVIAHAWSASDLQEFASCAEHAELIQVKRTTELVK